MIGRTNQGRKIQEAISKEASMRKHMWAVVVMILVIVSGLLVLGVPSILAGDNDREEPKVFDRDSVVYGRTFGEWSAAWEQWADSIPVANHPLFDNGDCSVGQSGSVWFLGGKFCANNATNCGYTGIVRQCTVPAGKALYFPVLNSEDSALEEKYFPTGTTSKTQIAELRSYVESGIDGATNFSCDVDGAEIAHLKRRFRVQSSAFGFTLPADNYFKAVYPSPGSASFTAGKYFPAVDDGVYVMLAPLSPGHHVIHFAGSFPIYSFSLDITYHLTVTK
jgi:hypothetical protein